FSYKLIFRHSRATTETDCPHIKCGNPFLAAKRQGCGFREIRTGGGVGRGAEVGNSMPKKSNFHAV
ncbi:MAG: hypothetical protein RR263_01220, partial [Oscillospiraceae bacterium]